MDLTPRNHKSAQHEDDHQHAGTTCICHHDVARNGPYGSEDADCQVVDQEQQQPAHEEPAKIKRKLPWKLPWKLRVKQVSQQAACTRHLPSEGLLSLECVCDDNSQSTHVFVTRMYLAH